MTHMLRAKQLPGASLALLGLLAPFTAATLDAQDRDTKPQWRALFNGKDLGGWTPKIRGHELGDNHADTFRVEDGILKVGYTGYEKFDRKFGHLFHDESFTDYRLRVEYRFVGDQCPGGPGWAFRNSGVMIHGQPAASMGKDQDFPASIEVQLLGGRSEGERSTANLCTPGTHVVMHGELHRRHCTNSTSKTYRGDGWVTVEIEAIGDTIRHLIDGEPVLEYTEPQLDPNDGDAKKLLESGAPLMLRGGSISLQSESHPVEFRKVEILELEPGADGWHDLLAGGDLTERWHTKGNWKLGADGVVTLQPRDGETGWRRFDAYLWLEGRYGDFEMEFDYKLEPGGNSGFYFHVGDEASPVQKGIEVQIYDSKSPQGRKLNDHDSGGIIPGIPPTAHRSRKAGEWNRFRITCRGERLTVMLNGTVVNDIRLDHERIADRPRTGAIGFQDHGLPLALRRIRIRTPE